MKSNTSLTTFYIETVLMIIIFVFVILIMTEMFVVARERNIDARQITSEVSLAQNTAQAVAASSDPEELCSLLDENNNAALEQDVVTAQYDEDLKPDPSGDLQVRVSWGAEKGRKGRYISGVIDIYRLTVSKEKPVYSIVTGDYRQEKGS